MEKRIPYAQFQSVKAVAKACDPIQRKIEPLRRKIKALEEECQAYEKQIAAIEAGIVEVMGFHVSDLVKKVIENKGIDPKTGKTMTSSKWVPTDRVSYDDATKTFVVTDTAADAPEEGSVDEKEEEKAETQAEESITTPMTGTGNDLDDDKEKFEGFMPAEPDSIFD